MAKLKNRSYTVMIVPDRTANVRRLRVPRTALRVAAGAVLLFVGVISAAGAHYTVVARDAAEAADLREQNLQLDGELKLVQQKVANIAAALDRVERLDAKLRMITQLNDPERNLAIGPVAAEPVAMGGPAAAGDEDPDGLDVPGLGLGDGVSTAAELEVLYGHLGNLEAQARREESSLRELQEYFHDQRTLLGAMPSVWPARGWVTSAFGTRSDPYTSDRRMHKGLDIAAQTGTPVVAPANGTVVFAGTHGAYGKVIVVDHGYGVNTRYGHLSEIDVKVGDKVSRGARIGAVGNTGRSTGPHLHYEVRVNGIPEDPRKFILD